MRDGNVDINIPFAYRCNASSQYLTTVKYIEQKHLNFIKVRQLKKCQQQILRKE